MIKTSKHKMLRHFVSSAVLASTMFMAGSAMAQLNQQTGVADPGRLERTLSEERLVPQLGPNVSVKKMSLIEAPEGAENIKFSFGGLTFDGAETYSTDDIYNIYGEKIGQEVSLADVYVMANQIALKYRNDGFVLTQVVVPPQTIEDGIVRLQVVEGFIDNVIIQAGDEAPSALKIIKAYASKISKGGALNIADMERQLLLINDLPGLNARSIIAPSKTTPGAADLTIVIDRDPFEAAIGADNYGSRFLGPFQLNGSAVLNSPFGYNEALLAQFVAAPDAGMELAFGMLGYRQRVGSHGTLLVANAAITDTDPGYTLRQFDVEGLSRSINLQVQHPFIRSRDTNWFGRFQFDWRNVESKNNVELTRKDRIRALRAGTRLEFVESILGVAVNRIDLQISQGIDALGASNEGDANMTRAAGDPTFTKVNFDVERLQRITSSVNVLLKGSAQLSNKPLLSSEEFGLGGNNTIRGYAPSEVVGDDGISGRVEVQWKAPSKKVQLFTFLDSGTVWNQDATNSGDKRASLTSTGIGARFDLPMDVDAEFTAAQPLNRDIQTQGERDPQFFFSVNKKF